MKLTDENIETEDKCIFEEIRKIGAYSNETLIEGCKEAEILLQLKEAPKLEKLGSLATKIASIMGADYKVETDEENSTITGTRYTVCKAKYASAKAKHIFSIE